MRSRRYRTCLILILLAWTGFTAAAAASSAGDAVLIERLEEIRARHGVPAVGALRLESDGDPVAAVVGTGASDDGEPVQLADAWHLGSNTKAMTATLAARLVEQGKIGWETTIAQRLARCNTDHT